MTCHRQRWLCLLLMLMALPLSPRQAQAADRYYIPPTQFNAAFQIMDMGFSNILGLFRNATGGFMFDDSTKAISHIKLALDANSLMTANATNARDLSRLLSSTKYPEITFVSTAGATLGDNKTEIKGTLTIHGVSKPASFEATLNHVGASPKGGGMWSREGPAIGLSLRGSFKRDDFGMSDEPEVPGRFGETITLLLEMQGIKQ